MAHISVSNHDAWPPLPDMLELTGTRRKFYLPYFAVQWFRAAVDGTLIVLASIIGVVSYQGIAAEKFANLQGFIACGIIAAVLYALAAHAVGLYRVTRFPSRQRDNRALIATWVFVSLFLTYATFLLKIGDQFSRGSTIVFSVLALVFLLISNAFAARLIHRAIVTGWVRGRRVVLFGSRDELGALDSRLLLSTFGLSEVCRVPIPHGSSGSLALTDTERSAVDQAIERAREEGADEIVLALSWQNARRLELFRDRLRDSPLPVQLLPDARVRSFSSNPSFVVKTSLSVEIQRGPLSRFEQLSKRILDIAASSIALLLLWPIMVIAAIAIKLDSPGTILFRQRRAGFNAKHFVIFKFRSMTVAEDGNNVVQARRGDARITGVGALLRKSSIDELPQLFNVLRGDMSLVGPRPHALAHDSYYGNLVSEYAYRHHVKPGITGWAQVNGYRGETKLVDDMKQRIDFDIAYINNWSLLLDLKIIWMTFSEVIKRRNAY